MNNLVVQLLLKTGTFSTDLKQAKGQIEGFKSGCQSAGKTLTQFGNAIGINMGALAKLGTTAGVAVLAVKEFKAIMESSQTTSDAMANALAGCKGVIDTFNRSLALSDFSSFTNGIWSIYDAAKAARQALDDLQDATGYYNLLSSENRTKFMTAREGYTNPDNTPEQKAQFLKDAQDAVKEGYALAQDYQDRVMDNFQKQVQAKAGTFNVELGDITYDQLKTVAREFLANPEQATAKYKNEYEDMLRERNEFKVPFWEKDRKFGPAEYNNISAIRDITRQNAAAVVGHTILELSDKDREALIQSVQAGEAAQQSATSQAQSLDRMLKQELRQKAAGGSGSGGGKKGKTGKTEEAPDEGSLQYWKNLQIEATKARDAAVKGTEEWAAANDLVLEAEKGIKEQTVQTSSAVEGSLAYWEQMKTQAETTMNSLVVGTQEYIDAENKVKEADKAILDIQKKKKGIQDGSSAAMNEIITKLQTELSLIAMGTQEWKDKKAVLDSYIASFDQMTAAATKEANQKKLNDLLAIDNKTIGDIQQIVSLLKEARNTMSASDTEGLKAFDAKIAYWEKKAESFEYKAPDTSSWDEFNKAMSNTSTIVSSLTNTFKEGSEVTAASILSMVATALPAIGSLISSISALTAVESVEAGVAAVGKAVSSSKHWIEAIAAVASLGAVVAAALASAKKVNTPSRYASGGIVGGSSYTGDRVTAQVNSGEMILNKQQQARLFKIANGDGGSAIRGGEVTFHISGTDLVGVLNNQTRKNRVIR